MPKIPAPPQPQPQRLLADFFLNELLAFRDTATSYELWWVQPRPLDLSIDVTGRGSFAAIWPDLMMAEMPLSAILTRILTLGAQVRVVCEPFSQAFTRSDILAGPEDLVNCLQHLFPGTFRVHTIPRVAPEDSAWIGHWGAVSGTALALPEHSDRDCVFISSPVELERLRARCREMAEGRFVPSSGQAPRRITTGELDMMRAIIRRSGRYVDVERLPQHTARSLLYRATDIYAADERVVIKVILDPSLDAERIRAREAIARRLGHPNIVRIYSPETFILDDGRPIYAIVMEYMPGGSLKDLLDVQGRLSIHQTLDIAIQICSGLAYAHEQGIVHRDIKPGNILRGSHGEIKVADFNIAKVIGLPGETMPYVPLGTPDYIPPEQVERAHQATPLADLYSLGCVLFEMLVGKPPFSAQTERDLVRQHLESPPPSARTFRPEVPQPLDDLIQRCLAKEPTERPSAVELAQELQALLPALPV